MIVYSATDAKNKFGEVLDRVKNGTVQISKNNRAFAYVLSADDYVVARSAIARDRVLRLIAAKDKDTFDFLKDYADGRRPRGAIQLGLELDNYGDVLQALAAAGLKPPRIAEDHRKTMALDFKSALRSKAIRLVLPDWGALISLAYAGKLDLLERIHSNIRFITTDVVVNQVTERVDPSAGRRDRGIPGEESKQSSSRSHKLCGAHGGEGLPDKDIALGLCRALGLLLHVILARNATWGVDNRNPRRRLVPSSRHSDAVEFDLDPDECILEGDG